MKNLIRYPLLSLVASLAIFSSSSAQYLYSQASISVRGEADLKASEIASLAPGENFEIIKWNRYNTRIRLSDGRIGWINKSLLNDIAPNNDTGFLTQPLKMTLTQDSTLAQKNTKTEVDTPAIDTQPSEVVSTENPADDYATDYDTIAEEAPQTYGKQSYEATSSLLEKVASEAWKAATKRRQMAKFCGGGYRSGNRSKCMCAQATKEALVNSGLCRNRPDGDALHTHTSGSIQRSCKNLTLSQIKDPGKAPGGSLIVYSGYAGKIKHNYGHIELKIPVTPSLKKKMGRNGNSLKIGQFLYCSDFCSIKPTKTKTNKVAAIYTL